MAHFCEKCGAGLSDGAQFCPECGARIAQSQPRQQLSRQQPYQQPAIPAPTDKKRPAGPKRSKGFMIAVIALAVIMGVEGVIAGVWYPGFFTGGTSDTGGSGETSGDTIVDTPLTEENYYKGEISAEGTGFADMLDGFNTTTAANDIQLRYTEEQLRDAPEETAAVTTDGGEVTAGAVTATFTDYDLQEDCDLVVKDLPALRDTSAEGQPDVRIKGYDISLSSGQHEFASEIELDIPRTAGDNETGSVVWFNEEMNRWENIYSEVSEDGQHYHIYTTHFTDYAEKIYIYDRESKSVKTGDFAVNLESGIFTRADAHGDISLDETQYWALGNLKGDGDISKIGEAIKSINNWDKYDKAYNTIQSRGNGASALFGLKGNAGSLVELLNGSGKASVFLKSLGKSCTVADAVLTVAKIMYETTYNGKKSGYVSSFKQAVSDHALDIGSGILGVTSLIPALAPAAPYLFVASVALYGISIYQTYLKPAESYKGKWPDVSLKEAEGYYREFVRAEELCFEDSKYSYNTYAGQPAVILVNELNGLSEEEFERFRKHLAEFSPEGTAHLTVNDPKAANENTDWINVFKALMWSLDDPSTFETVVNDLFETISQCYWVMNDEALDSYLNYRYSFENKKMALEYYNTLKGFEKTEMRKRMIEFLKKKYLPLMEKAASTVVHDMMNKSIDELERMVKYLNTYMEFYVEDVNVDNFEDSIYCVDYHDIKQNKEQWEKTYNLNDLYLPIRFHNVTQTAFQAINPETPDKQKWDKRMYYPYSQESTPNINYQDYYINTTEYDDPSASTTLNRVFACRIYDYLAMGAPTQMDFYDPAALFSENPECQTVDMVFPDKITPGQTVTVTITIGGDTPADIEPLLGDWVLDDSETTEIYKITEEELVMPNGEKRTIAMCTEKDGVYTLKLKYKDGEKEVLELLELMPAFNQLAFFDEYGRPGDKLTRIGDFLGKWDTNNSRENTWEILIDGDKMTLIIGGYSRENESIMLDCTYKGNGGKLQIYSPAFPKGYAELTPQTDGSVYVKIYGTASESFLMTKRS